MKVGLRIDDNANNNNKMFINKLRDRLFIARNNMKHVTPSTPPPPKKKKRERERERKRELIHAIKTKDARFVMITITLHSMNDDDYCN